MAWLTWWAVERLRIDPHGDEPSYIQLANLLREAIRSGQIRSRQQLPSISHITGETGLAIGTVRKAIRVLVDEGLAHTVPGRGSFAGPRRALTPPPDVPGGQEPGLEILGEVGEEPADPPGERPHG